MSGARDCNGVVRYEEELMDAAEQAQRALHGLQFTNMSTDMQRVAAAAGRDGAGVGTRWPQELMLACLCVSKPHQINDVSAR